MKERKEGRKKDLVSVETDGSIEIQASLERYRPTATQRRDTQSFSIADISISLYGRIPLSVCRYILYAEKEIRGQRERQERERDFFSKLRG